jgi:hypothetical protein
MATLPHTPLTVAFDAEEASIIDEIARVRGLDEPIEVLRALLIEAYDALWDQTFAESQDVLAGMAQSARRAIAAGETEPFDPATF